MPVGDPLYPVNLRLAGKAVLVVGAGAVAAGKVRGLLDARASVTVVSIDVVDEVVALAESGAVTLERRPYAAGEAAAYRLVVAATSDTAVNQAVHDDAEAAGVWVNAADDPARCEFTMPARVRRGDLLLTISTGGRSPALASWLRAQLTEQVGPEYEALLDLLAEERERLRTAGVGTESLSWQSAFASGILDLVRSGRLDDARELLRACLSSSSG
ncbi:MAG: bifunctional precorrin-2 dehydrogenase/sirohydrochlorin ferrochelatase [Acidimicrobiia bacterium]|nr:bifunctional precorrin-2 dehydrogenase/sirohydrochlorin ferrochelatase [Acidimicrobiia bacterium]